MTSAKYYSNWLKEAGLGAYQRDPCLGGLRCI